MEKLFKWGDASYQRGVLLQFVSPHPGCVWGVMLLDNKDLLLVPHDELTYVGLVEYK